MENTYLTANFNKYVFTFMWLNIGDLLLCLTVEQVLVAHFITYVHVHAALSCAHDKFLVKSARERIDSTIRYGCGNMI